MLATRAALREGEWVLVWGAGSGVGTAAVQIAKALGAHVVATSSSRAKLERAAELGADVVVDRTRDDAVAAVKAATDGRGADVVFENIGDPTLWPGAFNSLAAGGRLITIGAHGGGVVPLDVRRLYLESLTVIGGAHGEPQDAARALADAAAGRIQVMIGAVLPLDQARQAHELVEANEINGKVVLVP